MVQILWDGWFEWLNNWVGFGFDSMEYGICYLNWILKGCCGIEMYGICCRYCEKNDLYWICVEIKLNWMNLWMILNEFDLTWYELWVIVGMDWESELLKFVGWVWENCESWFLELINGMS